MVHIKDWWAFRGSLFLVTRKCQKKVHYYDHFPLISSNTKTLHYVVICWSYLSFNCFWIQLLLFLLVQSAFPNIRPEKCLFLVPNSEWLPADAFLLVLSINMGSSCLNWLCTTVIHYLFLRGCLVYVGINPGESQSVRSLTFMQCFFFCKMLHLRGSSLWITEWVFHWRSSV